MTKTKITPKPRPRTSKDKEPNCTRLSLPYHNRSCEHNQKRKPDKNNTSEKAFKVLY